MSTISAFDFSGRRVLVTGGARGIGKGTAIKFLELKATVIVLDKEEEFLAQLKQEYPLIETLSVDLRDWNATRELIKSILPIHHLANNAGILPQKPFLEIGVEDINAIYEVNFKAALNVAQVVAQGMIDYKIKDGTIVSTSSAVDSMHVTDMSIYCAFKAALTMLTKSMAVELAPYEIRVNCIRPGSVNTEVVAGMPEDFKQKAFGKAREKMVLRHKFMEPDDVANAFAFLSSPLSKCITGTYLTVDSGYSLQ